MAVFWGTLIAIAGPAAAGVQFGAGLATFPNPAAVGQTGLPAAFQIVNTSFPPDDVGLLVLDTIALIPSCSNFAASCAGGTADPGVYRFSPTGVGEAGTACAGQTFNIPTRPPAEVWFTVAGGGQVALTAPGTANSTCRIDFTVDVLRLPSTDSQPATPGVQTNQIGSAHGTNTITAGQASGSGMTSATVLKANPTLTTTASASVPVGSPIHDTATLSGGSSPPSSSGTITFNLFGPDNATCAGVPAFSNTGPVFGNGTYDSLSFAPAPGTYRYVATYSGDVNNNPAGPTACDDPAETVVVTAAATTRRPLLSDFNGDGQTDIAVWRPSNGTWYVKGISETAWGQVGDVPVPADYAGSPASELAVWRPSNGTWYVKGVSETVWGQTGDIPVPADYNGDGKADLAVFRPSNSTWYVKGISETHFGLPGDVPVAADYAGDARADIAVWRPSNGTWYVMGVSETVWGQTGDIPVPANYGGDAKADIAVFRPGNGTWYVRGISETVWGQSGDVPVVGDYNGGSTDIAVWRPSNATWYVRGISETLWGVATDIPV